MEEGMMSRTYEWIEAQVPARLGLADVGMAASEPALTGVT
jgi:hypothetical protein